MKPGLTRPTKSDYPGIEINQGSRYLNLIFWLTIVELNPRIIRMTSPILGGFHDCIIGNGVVLICSIWQSDRNNSTQEN